MDLYEIYLFSPIILAGLVLLIEVIGHRREAAWVADVAIPIRRATERVGVVVPLPLPRDWLDDHWIVSFSGTRFAYMPPVGGESKVTCIGVVRVTREGGSTIFEYRCLARPWIPAALAATASTSMLFRESWRMTLGLTAFMTAIWLVSLWFHKRRADEEYHLLTAELVRRSVEASG